VLKRRVNEQKVYLLNFKRKQMSVTKVLIISILIIIVVSEFACSVLAQNQIETNDKVLVAGKYSLKWSDIKRHTEIYEWIFASKFTDEQRKRFETLIVEEAQTNERTAKNIVSMLESFEKIKAASAEKREQYRQQLAPGIVAALKNEESEITFCSKFIETRRARRRLENRPPKICAPTSRAIAAER
jgi:leucyl aminopeptidase